MCTLVWTHEDANTHTYSHTVTHTLQRKVLLLTKRVTEFTAM